MMMATYCFFCRNCMTGFFADTTAPEMPACCDEPSMQRDYRAENVGFGNSAELKREREGVSGKSAGEAQRDIFLPTAQDYVSPEDPSGQKGLREWAETHGPKPENKRPVYPEMDKKFFATS